MKMVRMKELLIKAYEGGYAIPAINVSNMETIKGVLEVAQELRAPMILQVAPIQVEQQKISYGFIVDLIKKIGEDLDVTCSIHLDHGESNQHINQAIEGGFDSVMFDGSSHPYEENINLTSKVRKISDYGITIEGELGVLSGEEGYSGGDDSESIYTDPTTVARFIEETGIDCLAVSIGNAHGFYKGKPKLDFKVLEEIKAVSSVPLVMHGASGLSDEDLKTAIKLGIAKINFFTTLDCAFTEGIKKQLEKQPNSYMMTYMETARQNMMIEVRKIIKTCGCEGKI